MLPNITNQTPKINTSRLFNYVKIFTKLIPIIILILSITSISSTINSKASEEVLFNQELISNPQAFLNVVFKDDTHLDNIIENELNSIKNNQGYELDSKTFVINSLSGLSNIAGTQQKISIQGNYSTITLKQEYKNKLSEVITKLDDLINNNSKIENLTQEDRTKLDHQLSRMNPIELKAQRFWNWGDDKVLSIGIIGNTETLYDLKEILEDSGHVKNFTITETATIQKQIEDINVAVKGMSEEEKQNYVQKLYVETVTKELAKNGITGNIEDYMKKEMDNAPEYQKEVVETIIEGHKPTSFETQVSKVTNQLINGTQASANNGWCGFTFNKWWGGFSVGNCRQTWKDYNTLNLGFTVMKWVFTAACAISGGVTCGVIAGAFWLINYILGQTTQRGSDVANVCYSGKSKVTFSIWPISAGEPNCD
jgi:hypothetical protein